jgi:hypothetical protein
MSFDYCVNSNALFSENGKVKAKIQTYQQSEIYPVPLYENIPSAIRFAAAVNRNPSPSC